MKNFVTFILANLFTLLVIGQNGEIPACVSCVKNQVNTNIGASALGTENISSGVNSFAVGYQSEATGDYSIALPYWAKAYGERSLAFGFNSMANGPGSLALGAYSQTGEEAGLSISIGSMVSTESAYSIVLGHGLSNSYLINNIEKSFMVGFNTDIPTFFIGPGTGSGTLGKIGIGTTTPTQLLEVNGNMKVNDYSFLNHLTVENVIVNNSLNMNSHAITNISHLKGNGELKLQSTIGGLADITINSDGDVGIGTDNPGYKLDVNGEVNVDGDAFFQDNVGIGTSTPPTEKLEVNGNIKTTGLQLNDGLQGDGKFLISDINGFASWADQSLMDDGDWTIDGGNIIMIKDLLESIQQCLTVH